MDIVIVGMDLGKNSCSLVGMRAAGRVVLRRRLRRGTLVSFVGELGRALWQWKHVAALITSGGFAARGHEVRLMSPKKGMISCHTRHQLWPMAGYFWPHGPASKSARAASARQCPEFRV